MSSYDDYYREVRRIPRGRVSTYGTVARMAGRPGAARQVGYAMAALSQEEDVPWHRVVNAAGRISRRSGSSAGGKVQRALLEAEGVRFDDGGRIDLDAFGWP